MNDFFYAYYANNKYPPKLQLSDILVRRKT